MGFVADAGVLGTIITLGGDPIVARVISLPIALAFTFFLNKFFTFGSREGNRLSLQFIQYISVSMAGMCINFGVYSALLYFFGFTAYVCLIISSLAVLVINFFGYKKIFRN